GFPDQDYLVDGRVAAEIHAQPLVVAELAGPTGVRAAVQRRRGRVAALVRRRRDLFELGDRCPRGRSPRGAVHLELPQRVAPTSGSGRTEETNVATVPGYG